MAFVYNRHTNNGTIVHNHYHNQSIYLAHVYPHHPRFLHMFGNLWSRNRDVALTLHLATHTATSSQFLPPYWSHLCIYIPFLVGIVTVSYLVLLFFCSFSLFCASRISINSSEVMASPSILTLALFLSPLFGRSLCTCTSNKVLKCDASRVFTYWVACILCPQLVQLKCFVCSLLSRLESLSIGSAIGGSFESTCSLENGVSPVLRNPALHSPGLKVAQIWAMRLGNVSLVAFPPWVSIRSIVSVKYSPSLQSKEFSWNGTVLLVTMLPLTLLGVWQKLTSYTSILISVLFFTLWKKMKAYTGCFGRG